MKPSAAVVYNWLSSIGTWATSTDVVRYCPTTTPSKRLSELYRMGLVEKRQRKGRQQEYRALAQGG